MSIARPITRFLLLAAICVAAGHTLAASGDGNPGRVPKNESMRHALATAPAPSRPVPTARGRSWTDDRCSSCHADRAGFSHPVNIVASMDVPRHLPLSEGRVVCTTCHDSDAPEAHAAARTDGNALLRGSHRGAAFCQQCHDPISQRYQDQHAGATRQAHFNRPDSILDSVPIPGNSRRNRDSADCLSCHDGSIAGDANYQLGPSSHSPTGAHPINVPYRVTNPDADGGLVSRDALDPRIHLVNDQVSCATCHSLFSTNDALLVIDNDASRLCLSCHTY